MKIIGENWTDRQMLDFLLGTDSFMGFFEQKIGVLADKELDEPPHHFYDEAEDMFDNIRMGIFHRNKMDDPYAPMIPFPDKAEDLAPGSYYSLYNVYRSECAYIVEIVPCKHLFKSIPAEDEYFRRGGVVGIGNGWCVLVDEDGEVFEND